VRIVGLQGIRPGFGRRGGEKIVAPDAFDGILTLPQRNAADFAAN
jgi:hypothetical protein